MDEIKKQIKFPEGYCYDNDITLLQNIVTFSNVENNFQLLEKLIKEYNVDVNETYEQSSTLMFCLNENLSMYLDSKTLKFLLDNGADINHMNRFGCYILYYCMTLEKIEILVNYGFDIDLIDKIGNAFIHYLMRRLETDEQVNILKFLIDKKVNLNIKREDGKTIYDIINKKNNPKMYKLLMKHKKKNIQTDKKGINKSKKSKKNKNKNNRVFHRTTSFHL